MESKVLPLKTLARATSRFAILNTKYLAFAELFTIIFVVSCDVSNDTYY
jgi:hypothetical protein